MRTFTRVSDESHILLFNQNVTNPAAPQLERVKAVRSTVDGMAHEGSDLTVFCQ